jgi:putative Holliday junction resolvase
MAADAATGAVLGFDYGRRRIGVAVGQTVTRSATPLATLNATADGPDWPRLLALVAEWRPTGLVVGVPYNADGTPHDLTHEVLAFASALGERTGLPVHQVDERLSSAEAEATLREQRGPGRKRVAKSDIDAAAACVILNSWLR